MYEQVFSRTNPGCFVFLLDRSDSMKLDWRGSGMTLAEGAANALNRILLDLCVKSTKEIGEPARHYFDVGVFGYGCCPANGGGEGVESALGGALAGESLVSVPKLSDNPISVRTEKSVDAIPDIKLPVWIEPVHGQRTPMCQAIAEAGRFVYDWAEANPNSFPPIVINITDGIVTDNPYMHADLAEWARRLTTIETTDGPTLLMNIFLSPYDVDEVMFPTSPNGLPVPGPTLFDISSVLPGTMVSNARASGVRVDSGARGFAFNAGPTTLMKFLEIGTRVSEIKDR